VKRVGLWILGAAVGCFAAGMNVGLVAPGLIEACSKPPSGPDAEYLAQIVADYGLTSQQERSIRLVLERCREEETAARLSADLSTLPPAIQQAVLAARGRAENRFLAVLDAEQRARYDRESRPK
jgi:hypothetical protein